jgi:hypothetical protein
MQRLQPVLVFALLLTIVLFASGCGGSKLIPVEGKVTVGNEPLKTGNVTYHPDVDGGNKQTYPTLPIGTIDETGKYTLSTGGKPGAPPGKYKVTIVATVPSNPKDPYSIPKHLIDKLNSDVDTTTISKEVKEGAPAGHYDVALAK